MKHLLLAALILITIGLTSPPTPFAALSPAHAPAVATKLKPPSPPPPDTGDDDDWQPPQPTDTTSRTPRPDYIIPLTWTATTLPTATATPTTPPAGAFTVTPPPLIAQPPSSALSAFTRLLSAAPRPALR